MSFTAPSHSSRFLEVAAVPVVQPHPFSRSFFPLDHALSLVIAPCGNSSFCLKRRFENSPSTTWRLSCGRLPRKQAEVTEKIPASLLRNLSLQEATSLISPPRYQTGRPFVSHSYIILPRWHSRKLASQARSRPTHPGL